MKFFRVFRVWCFSWAPGNLYSLEFTILDTTGCPHMTHVVVLSLGYFLKLTSVTKNHTLWIFVTDSRRRETGPVVYLRSIYFWVICLIHKMRWVLVSKDHLFIVATHILNVKMPTLGYLFEFDLSRLPEAVPEVIGLTNAGSVFCWIFLWAKVMSRSDVFESDKKVVNPVTVTPVTEWHQLYNSVYQNLRSFLILSLVV